jgi:hypothetical protein
MTIRQLVGSSVYVDVDANIGAIALPVAQAGTRVIAAEANRGFPIEGRSRLAW